MARTQINGFRTVRTVRTISKGRTAAVVALAVFVGGGCTHAVKFDAPAEPIAVDVTVHIQQEVILAAAR